MARTHAWVVPAAAIAVAFVSSVMAASVSVSGHGDSSAAQPTPQLVKEFNVWINSFLFSEGVFEWADNVMGPKAAHYFLTWVRNFLAGSTLYYLTASIWHWVIYKRMGNTLFPKGMPSREVIWDQIQLAQLSTTVYAMLPVLGEFFIEEGYTRCYYRLSEVGGIVGYVIYTFLYLAFVEVGIYWMHRTLHTNKFLYKYVHALHHKYNSPETLSPWASIAFNPIDGCLQVHHTHYHVNFGQFFTFCDDYWGTLKRPEDMRGFKESPPALTPTTRPSAAKKTS